jgi:rare lipoprotein A
MRPRSHQWLLPCALLAMACGSSNSERTPARSPYHAGAPLARYEPGEPSPSAAQEPELERRYASVTALARFRGEGSYYGDSLAGHKTASGEPYDPRRLTAAHRSLPFGTIVRVTSEQNGRTVYVRINDRGPFVRGRVLDLSRAAAEQLELIRRGVAKLRVEVVEYGRTPPRRRRPVRTQARSRAEASARR